MNNWVKISSEELKVQMRIAGLKKGELQIKYAKDVCELEERINKAIEYIENYTYFDEDGCSYNSDVDEVRLLKILKGENNGKI